MEWAKVYRTLLTLIFDYNLYRVINTELFISLSELLRFKYSCLVPPQLDIS